MRAYAVQRFGEPVEPVEWSDPYPTGTQVVIEVTRCGVCHTDLHLQDGYYDLGSGKRLSLADRGIQPPMILGHEVAATVEEVGATVKIK